jgi:hypothetical protein
VRCGSRCIFPSHTSFLGVIPGRRSSTLFHSLVQHRCNRQEKLDGIINPARKPHPNQAWPLPWPDGRHHARTFSRKIDAERWLKVSGAETVTGQWVDPPAGEKLFVPYAKEWIGYKRSTHGETTATNTGGTAAGACAPRVR